MHYLGKNFILSIVASMGYCLEVIGQEGQGADETQLLGKINHFVTPHFIS